VHFYAEGLSAFAHLARSHPIFEAFLPATHGFYTTPNSAASSHPSIVRKHRHSSDLLSHNGISVPRVFYSADASLFINLQQTTTKLIVSIRTIVRKYWHSSDIVPRDNMPVGHVLASFVLSRHCVIFRSASRANFIFRYKQSRANIDAPAVLSHATAHRLPNILTSCCHLIV